MIILGGLDGLDLAFVKEKGSMHVESMYFALLALAFVVITQAITLI